MLLAQKTKMLTTRDFFILICFHLIVFVNGQGERCSQPNNNNPGACQALSKCQPLFDFYNSNRQNSEAINFLVQSQRNCGSRSINREPIVCCGTSQQQVTPAPTQPKANTGCNDPNGVAGQCTEIKQCPSVLNEFISRQSDPSYVRYIQNSNAICNNIGQSICCPPQGQQNTPAPPTQATKTPTQGQGGRYVLLTPETGCGFSNVTHNRVVGGEPALQGAWPWMALIGYKDALDETSFKCGGSLITKGHVLTAAHCLKSTLSSVRLGEHDLSTNDETRHVDIDVAKAAVYPNYDKKDGHSDLAILTLASDVTFSLRISPICLPIADPIRTRDFEGFMPFVAGWGRTQEGGSSAAVLQELQIPILANSACQTRYKAVNKLISNKQFDNAVLCAGVLTGGKDSCQGDSGGPLMLPQRVGLISYYYQVGIVSYGIGCARADIPGVYTRVTSFIDWIQEKINE